MDQSFNDQELSDIMKEIESLEENLEMSHSEPVLEERHSPVMEDLAQLEESEAIPFIQPHASAPAHVEKAKGATSAMSFKISGDINMELQFDVGGKVICLEVSETGLNIQIEGGMTFNVPLADKSFKKSA
jgi:hypothetical protein